MRTALTGKITSVVGAASKNAVQSTCHSKGVINNVITENGNESTNITPIPKSIAPNVAMAPVTAASPTQPMPAKTLWMIDVSIRFVQTFQPELFNSNVKPS